MTAWVMRQNHIITQHETGKSMEWIHSIMVSISKNKYPLHI